MKGSPMYRNYGLGKAPAKQMSKPMDPPVKQFEEGDYYDTRSKAPLKDYNMEKGSHDHPHSPAKNMKDGKYKHSFESPAKQSKKEEHSNQSTTVYNDRVNKKGQTQTDVLDQRENKVNNYVKAVNEVSKANDGLTEAQMKKANENTDLLTNQFTFSKDSIDNVNEIMNLDLDNKNAEIKKKNAEIKKKKAENDKRAKESGLFD